MTATFQDQDYKFKFQYRDAWHWVMSLMRDPSLKDHIYWWPVEKYLVDTVQGSRTRLYDEPNTAKEWWRIQVSDALAS